MHKQKIQNKEYVLRICHVLFACLIVAVCSSAYGKAGITSNNADPHYANLENKETFTDMRVKVQGGYVRITRRWNGSEWTWNNRWNGLSTTKEGTIWEQYRQWQASGAEGDNPAEINLANPLPLVYRAGQVYRRVSGGAGDVKYENQLNQFITMHENGYTWTDKKGNGVEYDQYGRIQSYYDKNKVYVYIERDNEGYIKEIQDHHRNTVITYEWDSVDGDPDEPVVKRLSKLTDYTGRTVHYDWSDDNLLVGITDVLSSGWTISYSDSGELEEIVDPEDRTTHYDINTKGQVISKVNSDGVGFEYELTYDEDAEEYHYTKIDQSGRVTETRRNEMGHVLSESTNGENQESVEIELSDNSQGVENLVERYSTSAIYWYRGRKLVRIERPDVPFKLPDLEPVYVKYKTITDARGNKTVRQFDQWKNEVKVTYPDGSTVTRTWNTELSVPTEVKDENGVVTQYEYDEHGNITAEIRAVGTGVESVTRYTYDEYGNRLSRVIESTANSSSEPSIDRWEYDEYGNITQHTDPLESITQWEDYDALGNPEYRIDARANESGEAYRWTTQYDAAGNLLEEENPYEQGSRYEYDGTGYLAAVFDAKGEKTELSANAEGKPEKVVDPEGHESIIEYDKAYRPTVMVDGNGHTSKIRYDEQGRIDTRVDGEGNETNYTYQQDKLSSISYPTYRQGYSYDSRDRLTQSVREGDTSTHLRQNRYDSVGNMIEQIDANGNDVQHEYDALGRLISTTDAEGGVTHYDYNHLGQLTYVRDPEGRVTHFEYDAKGRLKHERKGDDNPTRFKSYHYDANDNLIRTVNAEGETTTYRYDRADRLVETQVFAGESEEEGPVKTVSYEYDANGQVIGYQQLEGADGTGSETRPDVLNIAKDYTYTSRQEIESVTFDFGPFSKTYSYTYYPNGMRKTYTNPEGITYTYYYNADNTLAAIHIPDQGQLSYTDYDWRRPQTIMLPGGTRISMNYTSFLDVKERILTDPANNDIASAVYEYDLEQNINQVATDEGSYSFDYDRKYQLTDADYPGSAEINDESFEYDGVGNRVVHEKSNQVQEAVYNDRNQLIQSGSTEWTYNANGHTATKEVGGELTAYHYNPDERLVEVKINGENVGEYAYNPEGHRIRKQADDQITYFLYNEEGLAAEYDESGSLIKEYHFMPGRPWMTEPVFQRAQSGEVYYYQNDHLGTPHRMLDRHGRVVWRARYTAFGEARILVEKLSNPLRFAGQYYDRESGLHHNYFRDYDSGLGRYLQSDPIGLGGGINIHLYAENRPITVIDPFGLFPELPNPDSPKPKKPRGKVPVCFLASLANDVAMSNEIDRVEKKKDRELDNISDARRKDMKLCSERYPCDSDKRLSCFNDASQNRQEEEDDVWDDWNNEMQDIREEYWLVVALKELCDDLAKIGI